ncbi:hypothetical protein FNO01nite_29380 [Flavobacterium noncentrifugens]|nr:hypothetical protein FNO01nite_29380 [Flavobacterium noncentrifugens]
MLSLPVTGFSQALSGTYVVGASQAFPFNTLTNAVTRINTVGVSGPVLFLLDNTEYSNASGEVFPIKISQFSGTGTVNTLRIKPNTGKNVTIISNPNGSGYLGVPAAIQLDGADNIVIDGSNTTGGTTRNLTITNNDNISYLARTAVWIGSNGSNGATNISISNTKIRMANRNQEQLLFSGIYSGSNSLGTNNTINVAAATAPNAQLAVTNNEFINVRQGIYINGNSAAALQTTDVQVVANVLGSTTDNEKPSRAIYLSNISLFNITDNTISGVLNNNYSNPNLSAIEIENAAGYTIKRNTLSDIRLTTNAMVGYAMWIKGTNSNGVISENKVSNVKNTGYGIMRALSLEMDAANASGMLLANNFLSDIASNGTTTNTAHGIYIGSGRNIRVYFNTVSMAAAQTGASAALYVNGGSELDVRNNIFLNSSHTGTRYALYSAVAASAYTFIDYNDYYSQPVGFLGSDRASLANWKTATGKDANSVYILPVFTSATDLHLPAASNTTLDNLGTPLAAITTDIDGSTRSTTQPDMGADEFFVAPVLAAQPATQASAVNFTNTTDSGFTVNWTNGNGAKRLLLIRSGSAVNAPPVDGISYNAAAAFGNGSQIGTGNYVVYSGTGNSVIATGLAAATVYHVAVYEFNGAAGTENYLTTTAATGNRTTLNASYGWQITSQNTVNTITFDATVAGVNTGVFQGSGISAVPASGMLDSNGWSATGFVDGTIPFSGTNDNGGFGRGASAGGVSDGGIYAFSTSANNAALGIQPATGDFGPGSVSLRFQNQTGAAITSLSIGYKVYIYNDQAASSSFNFSHSADNAAYTNIPQLNVISAEAADAAPGWKASYRVVTITGLNIAANNYYYLRWSGAVVSGTADFDEFALDDIMLSANPSTNYAAFNGIADDFVLHGNTSLSGDTTVQTNLTVSSGKLAIGSNTLTLGGTVTNTIAGGLKGSAVSNITINGSSSPSLSFDQTTIGTTNLVNNFTVSFAAPKTVSLLNPVVVNGALSVALDQILNMGANALTGSLATISINGTLRTQNTTALAIPSGKSWAGNGTVVYDALSAVQTAVSGTYNNLTVASTGGAVAGGAISVNGNLDLPQNNPSASMGSLSMGSYVLTMGANAANTGVGDVTGITTRTTIAANTLYTFGHPNVSILFPNVGTLPTTMSLKTAIGTAPSWRSGAVNRIYDFTQTGGSGTKAVIKSHYLDSELNGNDENRLVDYAHIFSSNTTLEQGRSNFNTDENWIELTNVNVGVYFVGSFGAVNLTFDESMAGSLTWNGSVSDSWTTAANWTPNATPSDNTAVVVPDAATTPNDPLLNPANLLGSLHIEQDGILNAPDNSQLTINLGPGAWINTGTFNTGAGSSRVIFTNADATMAGATNFNNITINSGASVRPLTGNVMRIAGNFSLLGSFPAGSIDNTVVYSGTGQAIAIPTGTLAAYHNLTITGSGAVFPTSLNVAGNLVLDSAVDFANKTLVMNGSDLQTIGGNTAPVFNNLTINNTGGEIALAKNTTVSGTLNLLAGNLVIGNNDLTLGANAVTGTFGVTKMIVADGAGVVKRPFTATGSYLFPIGEKTSNPAYSPITVAVTSGTFSNAFVSVSVTDAIHPDNHSLQNYISRYWTVRETGITGAIATITANYITPELLTPASSMVAAQLTGIFDVQTNPWMKYQALSGLTLTAANAPLTNQPSFFTGIKGGDFTAQVAGAGTFCGNEEVKLTASVTGGDAPYTYNWSAGLGTEASATPPTTVVGTTPYTVTVKDANGISATANANVTITPAAATGVSSANQTVCFGYAPSDITISGYTGQIAYWQRSDNPDFTNPITINTIVGTLTGADAGAVTTNTYFRAAISSGVCPVVFSNAVEIIVKSTIWNGSSWSNGAPDSSTSAVITANYNMPAAIHACSLTVVNGAVVTIPSEAHVTLNGAVIVNGGSLTFANNANLTQLTNESNFGNIVVQRSSTPLFRLDYTMWGSPVTGSENLHNFSPQTTDNRFYILNTGTGLFAATDPFATTFGKGAGYLIRMPNNHIAYTATATALPWMGQFVGIPVNGPVALPLDISGQRFNLVSNPYPSLLDADAFLDGNQENIEGTVYFWRRRNNAPVAGELTSAYYATYTKAGGIGVEPIATASDTSEIPNGLIQIGQGFLVKALAAPATGTLSFGNEMRSDATNEGQFFKLQDTPQRSRIWLNLTNSDGAFGQTLLAYMEGAENGVDRTDGKYMNDGTLSFSSYLDGTEYIIQGRAPFVASDVVAMNFKTPSDGNYTIAIDHTDGIFTGQQDIFLRDKRTAATQNLKVGAYTFASEAGNFNDRFEIFYDNTLAVNDPVAGNGGIIAYRQNGAIVINSGKALMDAVKVFDIRGRLLFQKSGIHDAEERLDAAGPLQVLILRIAMENGTTVTKKIIN